MIQDKKKMRLYVTQINIFIGRFGQLILQIDYLKLLFPSFNHQKGTEKVEGKSLFSGQLSFTITKGKP